MADNVPEKELVDLEPLLPQLRALDWSAGITREHLAERVSGFPRSVYLLLPSEREFHSAAELASFYERAWQRSQSEGIPASGAAEDGGPRAWGPSPPSVGARRVGGYHGVGSGTDSGYTGSDDVGTDRSGATYGPGAEEPEEE